MFARICELVAEFIDFPGDDAPAHCAVLATWIILTYCYPAWPALPYLFFSGPAGSGKSRCFEALNQVVFRPLGTSSISSAALFRTIHDKGGVLLFDEAEQLKRSNDPGVGELLSMLLAGYKRGGRALRLDKVGDGFQTVAFDVYGPKGVACISGLPPALSSRCITIPMLRAAADSLKPRRRLSDYAARWQYVRDDLHVLALEHGRVWGELSRRQAVCPSITGRDFELQVQGMCCSAAYHLASQAGRIIAGSHENTAAEGGAALISPIWSNSYCMLAKTAQTDDLQEPCVGRALLWNEENSGVGDGAEISVIVEEYREDNRRGSVIRARADWHILVLHPACAHLLSNIL